MITAQQARENSYDKTILWCEKKLQPEIEAKLANNEKIANSEKMASKLFYASEVKPEDLKAVLEKCGYRVDVCNMTKIAGFSSAYEDIYNVTVYW